jgi:CP family cyanate transporter-like MFS transporter
VGRGVVAPVPTLDPASERPPEIGRRDLAALALLWLGGFSLRVTLLAVPPLIPAIHRDLGLEETGVSLLTGLPVLLMAFGAVAGSLLIARLGPRRAVVAGLVAVGLGSAARGAGPSVAALFAATMVMGAGVAVSQPAFPALVRDWLGSRIGLATAVYTNGLLVGETIPASFTGPLVAPALGGSWPLTLLAWSLPALVTAGLFAAAAPRRSPAPPGAAPARWLPDLRDTRLWRLGLVLGCASAAYFGTNAFIPDYVRATGHPQFRDPALTVLNASQLAASVVMLAVPGRLVGRRWPFAAVGVTFLVAGAATALGPGPWIVAWAALIGFGSALALILTLALPPVLAPAGDVARYSAGVFLISYTSSFTGPLVGGAAWDATGWPPAPFLALAATGLVMAALAATLDLRPSRQPFT